MKQPLSLAYCRNRLALEMPKIEVSRISSVAYAVAVLRRRCRKSTFDKVIEHSGNSSANERSSKRVAHCGNRLAAVQKY